jgi:hypothetical protein
MSSAKVNPAVIDADAYVVGNYPAFEKRKD